MLDLIGGRGRNRTYNLSVKSRMLCQLSYASRFGRKPRSAGICERFERGENSTRTLKNIAQIALRLQRRIVVIRIRLASASS